MWSDNSIYNTWCILNLVQLIWLVCIADGSVSSSASNTGIIIGSSVSSILLLIVVLVVIAVVVIYHKKKSSVTTSGNTNTITGSEVVIDLNPAYDVTNQSNSNTLNKCDDLKYEVEVDRNPSYGAATEIKKKKEDYDYVVGTEEMIKTDTNPSYVSISVGDNVLDDNPSYQAL